MRAFMLCAGLGTRLGVLGAERPKPMLPVCGYPIAAWGIANLVAHGITEIVINTHHRADVIRRELGDGSAWGARITYIHEDPILGTGGGVKHALGLLDPDDTDEPFLTINGKLIFDLDLTALRAAFAAAPADTLGMMVVKRVPDAKAWGAVEVQADGRITNVLGDGEHMFCGAQVTRASVMRRLPDGECDWLRQGYIPWMHAGERVMAYEHVHGYFAEHSTPERYVESNWALLTGRDRVAHPPGPVRGVDPTARVHPTAAIVEPVRLGAGAEIGEGVIVGPNAVVGDGARVTRSITNTIVWAGASGTTPAILVGDAGRVVIA
jgi:NDP-sugar pyrophosphorylase family protein